MLGICGRLESPEVMPLRSKVLDGAHQSAMDLYSCAWYYLIICITLHVGMCALFYRKPTWLHAARCWELQAIPSPLASRPSLFS